MQVSELRTNRIYKLTLPSTQTTILTDGNTRITLIGTDGDYDPDTSGAALPFSGIDYLICNGSGEFSVDDGGDYNSARATDATHIFYYITTLDTAECTYLAQYSEECHMGNVYKILKEDHDTLRAAYPNSVGLSSGIIAKYDPNGIYLINEPKKYRHNINLHVCPSISANARHDYCQFSFVNTKSTQYANSPTGYQELCSDLNLAGFATTTTLCPAKGFSTGSTMIRIPIGVYAELNGLLEIKYIVLIEQEGISRTNTATVYQYVHTSTKDAEDWGIALAVGCYLYDIVEET